MFLNTALTLRGMDFAIESGGIAGSVAAEAAKAHDGSAGFLRRYADRLASSFVLRDLTVHRRYPKVFESPRLYGLYPEMVANLLHRAYFVDGSAREHLTRMVWSVQRGRVSPLTLGRDLLEVVRAL